MDAAKCSQGFQNFGVVKPMEEMVPNTCTRRAMLEKKTRPPVRLNCRRCNSTNTKFCYYNNYSNTQPRYFCKTCRRYWTEGGSLRNVPVGGGSRKNRRSLLPNSSSASSSSSSDLKQNSFSNLCSQNPNKFHNGQQDLNLGFSGMQPSHDQQQKYSSLELLKTGMTYEGLNYFVSAPAPDSTATSYSNEFSIQNYKPTLSFSIDGLENRGAGVNGIQENGDGRVFFPFGEMKPISTSPNEVYQNKEQGSSTGY